MSVDIIKESLKDYAKDIRINIGNVLSEESAPGLNEKQIYGSALSVAMSINDSFLVKQLSLASENLLSEQDILGIKTAVVLMGMNNVYYKAVNLSEDSELLNKPAALRMTMMVKHGIDPTDFEIYSLAISTISGCGMCIKSHSQKLKQEGLSIDGIQSIIRIAAVIQAANKALNLEKQ